jgi:lysophospholipase L1-like esterase
LDTPIDKEKSSHAGGSSLKFWAIRLAFAFWVVLTCALAAELLVRLVVKGGVPLREELGLQVEPPGAPMYQKRPSLGYSLVPSQKLTITLRSGVKFTSTTTHRGGRVTSPEQPVQPAGRPEIWMLGCSFTFGWGVSDEQSFPWLIQNGMPGFEVVNFGVGGYGTLQSLKQLEEELNSGRKPRVIVLDYLAFHDQRNIFSPARNRELGFTWRNWGEADQPFAVLQPDGQLRFERSPPFRAYVPFVRHSALANFVDLQIVRYLEKKAKKTDHRREITAELVRRIVRVGHQAGASVLIADLSSVPVQEIRSAALAENAAWGNVSYSGIDPKDRSIPGEGHPNAMGHQLIAADLLPMIRAASERDTRLQPSSR